MELVVTAAEMRKLEQKAMDGGIEASILMERAALFAARQVEKRIKRQGARVLVACAYGNNGADGLALSRILYEHGFSVHIWLVGDREKQSTLHKKQQHILNTFPYFQADFKDTKPPSGEYDMIVDALLGIGTNRALEGELLEAVQLLNEKSGYKLALDIPTGISSDTGQQLGGAFVAAETVTFGAVKAGLLLNEGRRCAGRVKLDTCGIQYPSERKQMFCLKRQDLYPLLVRNPQGNKGSFGKLGIVAGSEESAGAAILCTQAAFACGAGYIKLLTHKSNRDIMLERIPETVLLPYADGEAADGAQTENLSRIYTFADAVAAGPGIGTGEEAQRHLRELFTLFAQGEREKTLVLDADALNILSLCANMRKALKRMPNEVVLTPHLLEFSRLSGRSVQEIKQDKIGIAGRFARENGVILVLKDAETVIAAPDGRLCINTSGNDGMAVAGSGDTLTGIVTALAAKAQDTFIAACAGVYLHGLAGESACKEKGAHSMMPTDLVRHLESVMKKAGKEAKEYEAL